MTPLLDPAALSARLTELLDQHAGLVEQVPEAQRAVKLALRTCEDVQAQTNALMIQLNRARQGGSILSAALLELQEDQQAKYHAAQCNLTKARLALKEIEWQAGCRADDVQQLRALIDPPRPPPERQTMRPRELVPVDAEGAEGYDNIVFPNGKAA
jgi:hypothetical protein